MRSLHMARKRAYSSTSPSIDALHAHFEATAARIASHRLHLAADPAALDALAAQGSISSHMAAFFKAELLARERAQSKA